MDEVMLLLDLGELGTGLNIPSTNTLPISNHITYSSLTESRFILFFCLFLVVLWNFSLFPENIFV